MEHRIHPVVGARFIWHSVLPHNSTHQHPNPAQTVILNEVKNPGQGNNECSSDHPNPRQTVILSVSEESSP
ncbi:MAG: hypothetical protein WCY21_04795 [Candidatus Cloacimonadaceae bacterium]|nr:hypothetical protein [Candidatus Cloacimonadota bacterium]